MRGRETPTGGTPVRGRTPSRSSTPLSGGQRVVPSARPRSPFVTALALLAVLQGLFFLLPVAAASFRLIGVALALSTLLAVRVLKDSGSQTTVVWIVAILTLSNFVVHLSTATGFPFRLLQLGLLAGYVAVFLAELVRMLGRVRMQSALTGFGIAAGLFLVAEALLGGPDTFARSSGTMEWVGAAPPGADARIVLAPNSEVKSLYPDNPRAYFDEPNALQSRWALLAREGSVANLTFPESRPGVLRVAIDSVPGLVSWHVALSQAPIRIQADERYDVRFRARADSARSLFVAVGQAHEPWQTLGLYREVRLDSAWRDFSQTFRATGTDRVAQLYFHLGGERPSVELADITMRAISTGRAVEAEGRRERSVTYRINSMGCRGTDVADRDTTRRGIRLVALGDGSTMGVGVHQRDTYVSRLESMLNASSVAGSPGARFEAINCGMIGHSLGDAQQTFARVADRYAPDLVLLSVNTDDDRVSNEEPSAGAPSTRMQRLFRVWAYASTVGKPEKPLPDYTMLVAGIKRLNADVRARGGRLILTLFRHRESPEWTALRSALDAGLRAENIPHLDLGSVLLPFGEEKLMVHTGVDEHPNELAHRLAADALSKFLADQGLVTDAAR